MKNLSDLEKSALAALAGHQFSKALPDFLQLASREPHVARHHYHLGICHLECQNLEAAICALKVSVKIDPLLQKAWFAIGSLVRHTDGNEAALPFWQEGYFVNPFSQDGASLWNEIRFEPTKES